MMIDDRQETLQPDQSIVAPPTEDLMLEENQTATLYSPSTVQHDPGKKETIATGIGTTPTLQ